MSFTSSNDTPLTLVARRDVLATAVPVAGRRMWVVKDPMTLEHHELGEAEHLLLEALSEPATLRSLKEKFERVLAPQTIQPAEIQSYLGQLHRAGLLVARGQGQATALAERAAERRRERWRWSWTELLALRLRGFNPDGWLDALGPAAKVLLSPLMLIGYALIIVAALALVVSQAATFVSRLPALDQLVAPSNWLWLAVVVAVVKLLHELAHALVAKRMGAEVHEAGLLLLVFVPTLYCDVTDIWNLPSKWQRMAVSAAGMGMELLLAAVATFVWWNSEPGLINLLAMNTMIVCSVGTLLVNANPLMRYDGYYLLADLTESTNLWQRSRDAWHGMVARWFFRPQENARREPWWLALYGGLSSAYMTVVLGTIFWTLLVTLQPLGFSVIAYAAGLLLLGGVVVGPARQMQQTLASPVRRRQFRPWTSSLVTLLLIALLAGLWHWPMADRVECPVRVTAAHPTPLVATLGGRLESALPPGTLVQPGDIVATLVSDDIQLAGQRLAAELALAELKVKQLQALRPHDPQANQQLPAAMAAAEAAREQLAEHQAQADRLVLRAPHEGMVMAHPTKPAADESLTLASWSGSPLEEQNRGAWLEPGTPVAIVADYRAREVALAIDETDVELVAADQRVRVQLFGMGPEPIAGTLRDISQVATSETQDEARSSRWGTLPSGSTPRYEARVELDGPAIDLPLASGGRAKIDTGRTSFGPWLIRELRDAFRLP